MTLLKNGKNGTVMQNEIESYRKRLFESQYQTVKLRHPEWSEEEVNKRCAELQRYVIEKETESNFINPVLRKIWHKNTAGV